VSLGERVDAVRERIARAAARSGRTPDQITLLAVSKTHPGDLVREAFACGIRDFGENKIQEAEAKTEALADLRAEGVRWHLIGHLQSNKAKKAAPLFDVVHSLDSADLAERLARVAADSSKVLAVYVQVDLAREPTKSGTLEAHLLPLLERLRSLPSLRVDGLMVLPPFAEDPETVRPYFRRLRELRDEVLAAGLLGGAGLSMGMSGDFEVAIEEGATIVRVGTAIFGERPRV
jgi:PLP dependent protein